MKKLSLIFWTSYLVFATFAVTMWVTRPDTRPIRAERFESVPQPLDVLDPYHAPHNATQSWDQENLKRNDHGCPTAIFIAPGGNLEQCF